MKLLASILAALIVLAMAGCTAEQRANCAVCRFVSGQWVCEKPVDPNTPNTASQPALPQE